LQDKKNNIQRRKGIRVVLRNKWHQPVDIGMRVVLANT